MNIRLYYTSEYVPYHSDLVQDLSDILISAREFNRNHQIYGVLYYAQGVFFQCLEGEKSAIEDVFEKIKKDKRHTSIVKFPNQEIDHIHFTQWSMKYIKKNTRIFRFFNKLGLEKFQPTRLNSQELDEFIDLLFKLEGIDLPIKAQLEDYNEDSKTVKLLSRQ